MRIPIEAVRHVLERALSHLGFTAERAGLCARLFAEASRDGVYSHGLARFPRFVKMIEVGEVDVAAEPVLVRSIGALEQWDGRRGPGNLNAWIAMGHALDLAREHGVGCVALRNTNHWMRGGTYGWQAADTGMAGMCWTNTNRNMPPWGAVRARIGNNPFVLAVPRASGPVVLDMAMAQFSYGALAGYRLRGESLPVEGGFDQEGRLTRDPGAIERSARPLPIGYWKGSGLSILLDLTAALLSGGRSTMDIAPDPLKEAGLSQVFVAWDVPALYGVEEVDRMVGEIIEFLHGAEPVDPARPVRYPGESTLRTRRENLEKGIPVEPGLWEALQDLARGGKVADWL